MANENQTVDDLGIEASADLGGDQFNYALADAREKVLNRLIEVALPAVIRMCSSELPDMSEGHEALKSWSYKVANITCEIGEALTLTQENCYFEDA